MPKPLRTKAQLSLLLQDSLEALPEVIDYRRRHAGAAIYFVGLNATQRDTHGRNWNCRDTCAEFPRPLSRPARRQLDALREMYDFKA
ncbi:hypothetical protein [Variovorax terrae]|uniref:Uncharacterized protein n=1 Tax=Variovorax terrae TaxID=2923278 RepID=A0A9X1VYW8_9BURK|nr:hypothetical protein [Variovorax terrae]MCJ0765495.1 hypothetical protein [Variovorax terrae]